MQYKTNLDDTTSFKKLDINRRGISDIDENNLKLCYSETVKINPKKKEDLLTMLPLISEHFHEFYRNLATTNDDRDIDPDISEESDAEN